MIAQQIGNLVALVEVAKKGSWEVERYIAEQAGAGGEGGTTWEQGKVQDESVGEGGSYSGDASYLVYKGHVQVVLAVLPVLLCIEDDIDGSTYAADDDEADIDKSHEQ